MTLSCLLLLCLPAPQDPTLADLTARHADVVRSIEYGRSRGGQPLLAYEVARQGGALPPERRPALLVVGGLTGFHEAAAGIVEHHVRSLAMATDEKTAKLLETCTVLLVPRANPDGLLAFARLRDREVRGNLAPVDDDRDGRSDEDPGDDLNGDGVVTKMRFADPEGEWVVDDKDPRVMRRANAEKGERGAYKLYIEGKDDDGDGEWNEDGIGDVEIDRNFAHGFAEHDPRSGLFAMSQPETRALADFVLAHPSIAQALVYGLDDTLLGDPKPDARGDRQPPTGIMPADAAIYREIGESYRRQTGRKGKVADRHDGSLWSWLYCDLGIPSFACSFWTMPAEAGSAAASAPTSPPTTESAPPASQPSPGRRAGGAASPAAAGPAEDEAKDERGRLAWCDANGEGARFVAWSKVRLPGLGDVEVGGWRPAALVSPPQKDLPALQRKHEQFLLDLLGWFARAELVDVKVTAKGDGLYELTAAVGNEGRLPFRTATGARSGHPKQTRLVLAPGDATLIMGATHHRIDDLALGKRQKLTWLLRASAGAKVKLVLTSSLAGGVEKEVTLQ